VLHLEERGFEIRHRYPFDGDRLDPSKELTPSIVLGGGQNVTDLDKFAYLQDELHWIESAIDKQIPLLGICLGAQLIAHALGAKVAPRTPAECEYGFYLVTPTDEAVGFLDQPMPFMQAHMQEFALPEGATRLAYSEQYPQQAFRYGTSTYAFQFHPEVNAPIFANWLADDWSDEIVQVSGAQPKSTQSQIAEPLLAEQAQWFNQTLDQIFV